jgi:hypothetical protein
MRKTTGDELMSLDQNVQKCNHLDSTEVKIMAQGEFAAAHDERTVIIRRGMIVFSSERTACGHVAAVGIDDRSQQVVCLILGHLPDETGYQSLPAAWIEQVMGDAVVLNAASDTVQTLPDWHGA